jgi:hypothetical protein
LEKWIDYLLRFLFYLTSKILLLFFLVALIIISFLVAKDYMNINVLVGDGFSQRASIILKSTDASSLSRIFSQDFIENDDELYSGKYDTFIIRSFIQDIDVDFKLVMPWSKETIVRTKEIIEKIDGELPNDQRYEGMPEHLIYPPVWDNAIYDVTLDRFESTWKITRIEKVEDIKIN